MVTMILDQAGYLDSLTLAQLRQHAIFLHSGIIGAVWLESPARHRAAFRAVEDAIIARPLEVAA